MHSPACFWPSHGDTIHGTMEGHAPGASTYSSFTREGSLARSRVHASSTGMSSHHPPDKYAILESVVGGCGRSRALHPAPAPRPMLSLLLPPVHLRLERFILVTRAHTHSHPVYYYSSFYIYMYMYICLYSVVVRYRTVGYGISVLRVVH